MREMKDSGVEWIGEIPVDWKLSKIKHHFSISSGTTPKSDEPEYWDGDIVWITPADFKTDDIFVCKGHRNLSQEGYRVSSLQLVPAGSIIFSKRAPIGQVVINAIDLCINQGCLAAVLNDNSDARFYRYVMSIATEEFELSGSGTTFKEISATNFGNIHLPLASEQEQKKCADYLDKKCSKIDEIIEKQQAIIDKLKEYKSSLITEAVTKGLNPNIEMKDSGAEFVGKIPKNWSVAKLGSLFNFIGGYAFNSAMYVSESQNQVVRMGNVKNGYMLLDSNPVFVNDEIAEQAKKFLIKPNYILFTMTGTKGKRDYFFTHVVTDEDCEGKRLYINQRVGCFVAKEGVHPSYYGYLLKDNKILDGVFLYETGTANQGNLGIDSISRTKVHVPPYKEQIEISEYLSVRCKGVDKSIEERENVVEKLQEYKKSLIYEVVTGKKEV